MNANVGSADKLVRLVIAVVAAVLAFVVGAGSVGGILLLVVAVVMLGTAAVGFCPLYRLFGMSTCKVKTNA
ncbi:MAG: DUF2892 domain-containing protein [Nocardioidaceae bacterium]